MSSMIYPSAKAKQGEKCTHERYLGALRAPSTLYAISRIRSGELTDEEKAAYKASLPAVLFQGTCEGPRSNANVRLNGLVVCDFDHAGDARRVYDEHIAPHAAEVGLMLAYVSPSGNGLKTVTKWRKGFSTIAENQQWVAELCGLTAVLDAACKDPARLAFVSTEKDILYLDEEVFEYEAPEWFAPIGEGYHAMASQVGTAPKSAVTAAAPRSTEKVQTHYKNIDLKDLAAVVLDDIAAGKPIEGERNQKFFEAASLLRVCCDDNAESLFYALSPYSTLPEEELRKVCSQAVRYQRKPIISQQLQSAIEACTQAGEEAASAPHGLGFALPSVFKEFVACSAPGYEEATVLALAPILGVLATHVRSTFNGDEQTISLQEVVIGEQGSSKGRLTFMWQRCLRTLIEQDKETWERFAEWQMKRRSAASGRSKKKGDEAQLSERPHGVIRIVPDSHSFSSLLEILQEAGGQHIFYPLSEISVARDAEKRGWSNIHNILKIAFDGGVFTQRNLSIESSFNGSCTCYMNTLWAAQPSTFDSFYTDEKWQDGTVGRTIICDWPSSRYKPAPRWKEFTPAQEAAIDADLEHLAAIGADGKPVFYKLKWLEDAMEAWGENKRLLAMNTNNEMMDIFRRRAAVIGYRAGMLAAALYDGDSAYIRRNVKALAIFFADKTLEGQLRHANRSQQPVVTKKSAAMDVLNALPHEFSREALEKEMRAHNLVSPVHTLIWSLSRKGLIIKDAGYGAEMFTKTVA